MGISLSSKGSFSKTEKFLQKSMGKNYIPILQKYGEFGVSALAAATPVRTGRLASSWRYEIEQSGDHLSLVFHNDDIEGGRNIAILIDAGYATKNRYFVQGKNFIDPSLDPVLEKLADQCWKEVTSE